MAGKRLWRHGDFRSLWLAMSVSLLGTQVSVLAFPLIALLTLHATPEAVSLLSAVEFLPSLLLGLPAGAWVDRLPRRPVLIACDVVRALAMLSVPLAHAFGALRLPQLFAVAFVIGLGTLFFDVAQMSYLPALIEEEDLADGNAKIEGSRAFAQFAGPGLGGLLVQAFSAAVAITVNVATYVVSALFLMTIRGHGAPAEHIEKVSLRGEIAEGLRFVFRHPLVRPLALCAGAADLAFAAVLALQVPFGVDTLHLRSAAVGLVLAVGSVGGLLGAVITARVAQLLGTGRALLAGVALFTLGAVLIPVSGNGIVFGAGLFVVYVGVVLFNVLQTTVCQTVTPPRLLGRMNATLRFISWGAVPVGASVGGVLVAPLGLRGVMWVAAGVCALSILPLLFSELPSFKDQDPSPEPEPVGTAARPEGAA
jgi:MFS family permease